MKKKFYNGSFKKSVTSLLAATLIATGMQPQLAFAGVTLPLTGESAKGENQPFQHGYRAIDIENWTPETDSYAELLRAKVPMQERIEPFAPTQANPKLETGASLTNLNGDYGNSFFDSTPYTNEFSQYVYNFWQYTDYYGGWHGMATEGVPISLYVKDDGTYEQNFEFGVLNLPNPAYTNAAHKNGVASIGCVFIPRTGQPYKTLLKKDENGEYIVAKKLIEMKEYFGFDGYFINQETSVSPEDIVPYKEFTKTLVDAGVYVQWYDCIDDVEGKLTYKPKLIESHSSFVLDPELGRVNDSIFMNYNWNSPDGWNNGDSEDKQYINDTVIEAMSRGIDPLTDVLMGVELSMGKFDGSHNSTRNLDLILDDDGNPVAGMALFTPDYVQRGLDDDLGGEDQNKRAKDNYQWMIAERERMLYTGVTIDAKDTGEKKGYSREDVGVKDASEWAGVSKYIAERSVLDSPVFVTNFNTGHGLDYYIDGKLSNPDEWSNINLQDVLPTWQWWIDVAEMNGSKLQADFDYGSLAARGSAFTYKPIGAYKGGSSLAVNGVLDSQNFLRLYKTDMPVTDKSKVSITFNKVSGASTSTMRLGLIFKDNPLKTEYVEIPDTQLQGEGWITKELDLSQFAGKSIATIGLEFNPNNVTVADEDYQMNIGELKFTDGNNYKPSAPKDFTISQAFDTNEVYVKWTLDDYENVKQYNLYAELEDGTEKFLGGAYDDIYYIKKLDSNIAKLKLRAVGNDGTESEPASIDFSYSNKVKNLDVKENSGSLDVSWENPDTDFENVNLKLVIYDKSGTSTVEESVTKADNKVALSVSNLEGTPYELYISTDSNDPIVHAGNLKDVYCEPYNEGINTDGDTIELFTPASKDWWYMFVRIDGKLEKRTRGLDPLDNFEKPSTDSVIEVTLVDYDGNKSEPTYYDYTASQASSQIDFIEE